MTNDANALADDCAQNMRSVDAEQSGRPADVDADAALPADRASPPPRHVGPKVRKLKRHPRPLALISGEPPIRGVLDDGLAVPANFNPRPHPAADPGRATRSRRSSAKNKGSRPEKAAPTPLADPPPPPEAAAEPLQEISSPEAPTTVPPEPANGPDGQISGAGDDVWGLLIRAYYDKPVEFALDVLGVTPDPWQAEVMAAVAKGERRISIRAGHGVGKTAFCAWLVIWWMVTRFPQKTVLTAPTASQLFDALFPEVKFWFRKLPPFIADLFELKAESIEYKPNADASFVSAKTSSAEKPEAMQGVHSEHVLLICDEASGIPEAVYEAGAGSMSGFSAHTILISNPTRNTGLFYETHHRLKSYWFCRHVSCIGNPRVSPDFLRQMETTYGEDSNQYRVRVLGDFALREDDVLIPAELVDSAMDRDIALEPFAPLIYGLDVARFGDDRTVLAKRKGNRVVEIKWWNGYDTMETVGRVLFEANQDHPVEINVDVIGYGAGIADRLREQGLNVRDVNVAESAALNPTVNKLRDELWFNLRDWLATRAVGLPKIEGLREELLAPTYGYVSNGRLKVEDKDQIKKKLRRSPDLADAICLTFAGQAAQIGGRAPSWVPGKPLRRNIRGVA